MRKAKPYDLQSVTKSLSLPEATNLTTMAMQRILKCEGMVLGASRNYHNALLELRYRIWRLVLNEVNDFIYVYIKPDPASPPLPTAGQRVMQPTPK